MYHWHTGGVLCTEFIYLSPYKKLHLIKIFVEIFYEYIVLHINFHQTLLQLLLKDTVIFFPSINIYFDVASVCFHSTNWNKKHSHIETNLNSDFCNLFYIRNIFSALIFFILFQLLQYNKRILRSLYRCSNTTKLGQRNHV